MVIAFFCFFCISESLKMSQTFQNRKSKENVTSHRFASDNRSRPLGCTLFKEHFGVRDIFKRIFFLYKEILEDSCTVCVKPSRSPIKIVSFSASTKQKSLFFLASCN